MSHLFFSEDLIRKLDRILDCPLSALEAPAGYGKTTAVHRVVDGAEGEVLWYTAVESMPDTSFRWFVHQIERVDEDAAATVTVTLPEQTRPAFAAKLKFRTE